jgi:hypothetical protein
MKKLIFLLAICSITLTATAQKARVYEHFTTSFAFEKGALVPSVSYTQTLAVGDKFGLRFNTGLRFTQYIIKSGTELGNTVSNKERSLRLNTNVNISSLNIPMGIEVGNRILAIGINADLAGFTLRTERGESTFDVINGQKPVDVTIAPKGFNFLVTQNGTLNSQAYVSVTPNQSLSIRVGMAYTQAGFNTSYPDDLNAESTIEWDSFKEKAIRPFVALQFNFEK